MKRLFAVVGVGAILFAGAWFWRSQPKQTTPIRNEEEIRAWAEAEGKRKTEVYMSRLDFTPKERQELEIMDQQLEQLKEINEKLDK